MAELVFTNSKVSGAQSPTINILSLSDTITWEASQSVLFQLNNVTGGAVNVNFLGDAASTVSCGGLGDPIDVSGGYNVALLAGETKFVVLSSIKDYLDGNIAITSDNAGAEAILYRV